MGDCQRGPLEKIHMSALHNKCFSNNIEQIDEEVSLKRGADLNILY